MTALCGVAQNYTMLLAARLGVGIGEAGGGPASLSIIADLFEHRRRATAMAVFSLGTPMAALINLTINTQIAHLWGWRAALLAAAVPGLVLALAMWLFMREPVRGTASSRGAAPPLGEVLRVVVAQRSLFLLLAGGMCAYVVLIDATRGDAVGVEEIHAFLERRDAVRDFCEVITAHRLLFLEVERRVVGGDGVNEAVAQAFNADAGDALCFQILDHAVGDRGEMHVGAAGRDHHDFADRRLVGQIDRHRLLGLHLIHAGEDEAEHLVV
eukprot:gene16389-21727_t